MGICLLSSSEVACIWISGEQQWERRTVCLPCLSMSWKPLVGHFGKQDTWTRWTFDLIWHRFSCALHFILLYYIMLLYTLVWMGIPYGVRMYQYFATTVQILQHLKELCSLWITLILVCMFIFIKSSKLLFKNDAVLYVAWNGKATAFLNNSSYCFITKEICLLNVPIQGH